jgi:phosphonate transport system permease protein
MAEISLPSETRWRDPAWHGRVTLVVLFFVLLVPVGYFAEFNPLVFFEASSLRAAKQFLVTFYPPAHSAEFLQLAAEATWKTVAIATVGVFLALLIAIPLSLVANQSLSISMIGVGRMCFFCHSLRYAIRWLLIALRSVPELVWALLFVRAVGLGDTAGVMAIALTYGGMLGKVFMEIFESAEAEPTRALLRNGSSRLQAFFYGALPACLPELVSYTVYRWECAIRASVIMGFVGAGGLGQQMELSMRMLAGGEVISFLAIFVLLVWIADLASKYLRKVLD